MKVMRDFTGGALLVLKIIGASMLYRHPYRTSAEGLRADWLHIGKDIESVMGRLGTDKSDE